MRMLRFHYARAPSGDSSTPAEARRAGRAEALAAAAFALLSAALAAACWLHRGQGPAQALLVPQVSDVASLSENKDKRADETTCGLVEDGVEYHTQTIKGTIVTDITTPQMCCAVCEADPKCGAWTWGKQRGIVGLTDICYLKEFHGGETIKKLHRPEVVSGMPARGIIKHGMRAALMAQADKALEQQQELGVRSNETCLGRFTFGDYRGNLSVAVLPGADAGRMDILENSWLIPQLDARAYFVEHCEPFTYAKINVLGKMFKYTTHLAGLGCGCNAKMSLVVPGDFLGDHESEEKNYRIDVQGGNQYAWSTQLHVHDDLFGMSVGYGGGGVDWVGKRDWTGDQYGPGGKCIDTAKPFEVAISFPVDGIGMLEAVEVTLSQFGRHCPLKVRVDQYLFEGRDGLAELSKKLSGGMTPTISYTAEEDLLWLDGIGMDGKGPCVKDVPEACPAAMRFYSFSLTDIPPPTAYTADTAGEGKARPPSYEAQGTVEQAVKHIMSLHNESVHHGKKALILMDESSHEPRALRGQA